MLFLCLAGFCLFLQLVAEILWMPSFTHFIACLLSFFWINRNVLAHHCELNTAWECEVILCLCSEYISGQGGLRISWCMFKKGRVRKWNVCLWLERNFQFTSSTFFCLHSLHSFYIFINAKQIHHIKGNTRVNTHSNTHTHTHCCILTVFLSWCLPLTT